MNWKNLNKNKCPRCGKDLCHLNVQDYVVCSDKECGFKIGLKRFGELTTKLNGQQLKEVWKQDNANQIENNNE